MPSKKTAITETDKARIQELAHELDALVPRTDAIVLMNQYRGGCDESQITATETGYLRMGIELLKASVVPPLANGTSVQLDVDWEYLIAERSDIGFHMFHVDNALEPDAASVPRPHEAWQDRVAGLACGLACLLLVTVFGVGIITVIQWIFR